MKGIKMLSDHIKYEKNYDLQRLHEVFDQIIEEQEEIDF
jgi:hypothetical protein